MISKTLSITFINAFLRRVRNENDFPASSAGKSSRDGKLPSLKNHVLRINAGSVGMEAKTHSHYVRNYMLHMPFTHRSTLAMNTNRVERASSEGGEGRFFQNRKHKRGLSFL